MWRGCDLPQTPAHSVLPVHINYRQGSRLPYFIHEFPIDKLHNRCYYYSITVIAVSDLKEYQE